MSTSSALIELLKVVKNLRDPKSGCPWDIAQTHQSLIPYVLEESHEVADAIRSKNKNNLKEELGDLLLQVLLHSEIASENKHFTLEEVMNGIKDKLIRRHPHVFKRRKKEITIKDVEETWESIKSAEKPIEDTKIPISESLRRKVRSQSAVAGTMKISNTVTKLGFEWESLEQIFEKMNEEILELKEALKISNNKHAEEELGDVIFCLINIARWNKLNPEEGLIASNQKFLKRFSYIEEKVKSDFSSQSKKNLTQLWNAAKHLQKNRGSHSGLEKK